MLNTGRQPSHILQRCCPKVKMNDGSMLGCHPKGLHVLGIMVNAGASWRMGATEHSLHLAHWSACFSAGSTWSRMRVSLNGQGPNLGFGHWRRAIQKTQIFCEEGNQPRSFVKFWSGCILTCAICSILGCCLHLVVILFSLDIRFFGGAKLTFVSGWLDVLRGWISIAPNDSSECTTAVEGKRNEWVHHCPVWQSLSAMILITWFSAGKDLP